MTSSSKQSTLNVAAVRGVSLEPMPASRKVYVAGQLHPFIRVPFREIAQTSTRIGAHNSAKEVANPPLSVYDASGPYSDPSVTIDVHRGLAPLRSDWIRARSDVAPGADGKTLVLSAARPSPNGITHAVASSLPKWNSSPFAKTRAMPPPP